MFSIKPIAGILALLLTLVYVPTEAKTNVKDVEWTKSTYDIYHRLQKIGFEDKLAKSIINECKKSAKNPKNCVIVAWFIGKNESGAWRKVNSRNSVFWISGVSFETKEEAVKDFVKRYNKHWFRQTHPTSFYSATPKVKPKTQFCMSEDSSGAKGACPNGLRISMQAYNSLVK